ncbi:MAG TPA: OB-fold nucleic acid binding domain-containing protein, partial [Planctomycetaceae bacterium]
MKPEEARREKLRKIRELGYDPWGQRFDDHQAIGAIRAREGEITVEPAPPTPPGVEPPGREPEPVQHGPRVRAAGRIVLERKKGKLIFIDIRDWTGQLQLLVGRNQIGEENWALAE